MAIKEKSLMKALSEMEAIAKGGKGKLPKTTAEANGGLSNEGDKQELAVKGEDEDDFDEEQVSEDEASEEAVEKAHKKGKKKGLVEWAKEEESEEAHKGHGSDDEESEDESESESEEPPMKKGKKVKKSTIADLVKSDSQAGAVVDVSPLIENLVDQVSEAVEDMRKSIDDSRDEQSGFNRALAKAVNLTAQSVLALNKRFDGIEDLPAGSRRTALTKGEVQERFDEGGEGGDVLDFNRHQVLDAMTDLAKSGSIPTIDVTRYETTGTMDPDVLKKVENHLKKSA